MGVTATRLAQCRADCFLNPFDVLKDFVVPEPQDSETFYFQPMRALGVLLNLVGVLSAVEFNDQACGEANEIHDVIADGRLSAEFETVRLPKAEPSPKPFFGFRQVGA